jgi:hypothetical protein
MRAIYWVLESTGTQKPALDRGSNHRTDAAAVSSRIALPLALAVSRYGSAGELPVPAWLPIVTGHEGLGWCVPCQWDNTRPLTGECSV